MEAVDENGVTMKTVYMGLCGGVMQSQQWL